MKIEITPNLFEIVSMTQKKEAKEIDAHIDNSDILTLETESSPFEPVLVAKIIVKNNGIEIVLLDKNEYHIYKT